MTRALIGWAVGLGLLIGVWWLGSLWVGAHVMPGPFAVWRELCWDAHAHLMNGLQTIAEAAIGLALAAFVSVGFICVVGIFASAEYVVYPTLTILKSAPAVAFVPLFTRMLGIGMAPKVVVAALIAFFPIAIGGIDGLRATPTAVALMADSYGGYRLRRFWHVRLRYSMLGVLTGLKMAAPMSVVGAVVGEYVVGGSPGGLGAYIITSSVQGQPSAVFGGALVASAIGIAFFCAADGIRRGMTARLRLDG